MPRILVTDDSQLTRRILKAILVADGHEVLEAPSGSTALEMITTENPDCVFLDLLMPDMDGFEVLNILTKRGIRVPVVVLTADIQKTVREKCMKMGAVYFLNKPPKEEELRVAIQTALAPQEETPT
jgi:CheY-like chemotaxis protein